MNVIGENLGQKIQELVSSLLATLTWAFMESDYSVDLISLFINFGSFTIVCIYAVYVVFCLCCVYFSCVFMLYLWFICVSCVYVHIQMLCSLWD